MSSAEPEKLLPYFFVSYAHDQAGGDDQLVRKFFHDLRADVRLYSAVRDDRVGFLDANNLRAGHRWSPELVRALAHCQVFLALCSPTYFSRPSCGKEWAAFRQRLRTHEIHTRRPAPPSLIPLFWVPVPERILPAAANEYQHRDDSFGPAYDRHRLRDLVRLDRHRDDYLFFISTLAQRIVALSAEGPPPAERSPEFDAIEAAFPAADPTAQRVRPGQDARPAAPPPPGQRRPARREHPQSEIRPILNPNLPMKDGLP